MYIYHAFIDALSTHIIHINLNTVFYTHVEDSPTKTIYIIYIYMRRKKITAQYAEEKWWVLSFDLKDESENECPTEREREFHMTGPMC